MIQVSDKCLYDACPIKATCDIQLLRGSQYSFHTNVTGEMRRGGSNNVLFYPDNFQVTQVVIAGATSGQPNSSPSSIRYNCPSEQIIIRELNPNKLMTTVKLMLKKLTRQEPEKTLVQVGFMDENEDLTQDGRDALQYLLLQDKKDGLKELADSLIEVKN